MDGEATCLPVVDRVSTRVACEAPLSGSIEDSWGLRPAWHDGVGTGPGDGLLHIRVGETCRRRRVRYCGRYPAEDARRAPAACLQSRIAGSAGDAVGWAGEHEYRGPCWEGGFRACV